MRETNPSDVPAPTEEFFQALEERRTRALVERDMAVLEELHARNYQLITPAGRTYTRERYLAAVKAEPFYAEWEVGQVAVRRVGGHGHRSVPRTSAVPLRSGDRVLAHRLVRKGGRAVAGCVVPGNRNRFGIRAIVGVGGCR